MFNVEGDKHREDGLVQLTLDQARKGLKGGLALRDQYGVEYLREIGSRGGKAAARGKVWPVPLLMSRLSVAAKLKKKYSDPRTVKYWDGTMRRLVPYTPPKSRRKRPIMVQIMLDDLEGVNI